MAAGQDAGDRNMSKNGRKVWERSDYNEAAHVTNGLLRKMDGQDRKRGVNDRSYTCNHSNYHYWPINAGVTKGEITMTIYEIKERTRETSPYFFTRSTMRFFGQTLKDFRVYKQPDGRYLITAPFGPGKPKGKTERIFDPETNELERVK